MGNKESKGTDSYKESAAATKSEKLEREEREWDAKLRDTSYDAKAQPASPDTPRSKQAESPRKQGSASEKPTSSSKGDSGSVGPGTPPVFTPNPVYSRQPSDDRGLGLKELVPQAPLAESSTEEQPTEKPKGLLGLLRSRPKLRNPGKYEDYNKEHKEITSTQELFDGFRFEYNRSVMTDFSPLMAAQGSPFTVVHGITMGSSEDPAAYSLQAQLLHGNKMLIGRIDTEGQFFGRFQHNLTKSFVYRLMAQLGHEEEQSVGILEAEYHGDDYNVSAKYSSGTQMSPSQVGLAYMQAITNKLALGCDALMIPAIGATFLTFGGRYREGPANPPSASASAVPPALAATMPLGLEGAGDSDPGGHVWTAQVGTLGSMNLSYTHRISSAFRVSTGLTLGAPQGRLEPLWTLGYEWKPQGGLTRLKTRVDSQWKVSTVLEQQLGNLLFHFSGELDHAKKNYRFGVGFTLMM